VTVELKKTPLYKKHLQNNGRIVDFAGWALPVEYTSMMREAKAVRVSCGMFDVTHMAEILIKGKGAFEFLGGLLANNIYSISRGQMQYNLFLNQKGGIIEDLMIYHLGDSLLCVVNASNKNKVLTWLTGNKQSDVEIIDKSDETALISVQGPNSYELMNEVFAGGVSSLEYMYFIEEDIDNKEVIISRSGYTGEDGFEIYIPWQDAGYWWDRLTEVGRGFGLKYCGLGSRDILRIEAGYPLYGHEIDEITNPYEVSLGWVVKLDKDFIGKEKILEVKRIGLKRKRVGFIMQERVFPRQGYSVYSGAAGIGGVCSGTYSPNAEKFIGMACLDINYARVDSEIEIEVRGKLHKAKVAEFPFVDIKAGKTVKAER